VVHPLGKIRILAWSKISCYFTSYIELLSFSSPRSFSTPSHLPLGMAEKLIVPTKGSMHKGIMDLGEHGHLDEALIKARLKVLPCLQGAINKHKANLD